MGVFETMIAQSSRKPNGLAGILDRRTVKRVPSLRSTTTGLTSHLWELELLPAFSLVRLSEDIESLAHRSLDRNIFFESAVLRSAWPRLTSLLAPHGAWMLCLWESTGENRHLRVFMPMRINKVGIPRKTVLQPLANDFMPLGTPLVDRDCPGEAAETLLRLMADPALKLPGIFDFIWQRQDSATFKTLLEAADNLGLQTRQSNIIKRAALFPLPGDREEPASVLGKKRMRELARQRKKLRQLGTIEFQCARTQDKILEAVEGFLTLELLGWKGRRGTALYNHKKIAAFSRQIVSELAARNHCEIFSLKLDNKPIASLIMLGRDGQLVPWKMAFDERMFTYSPGMQVMVNATQTLLRRKNFIEADSLAVENHEMMNRVWPDKVPIADLAIAMQPDESSEMDRLIAAKKRLRSIRNTAKKLLPR
jgi:CelD/BcsL family acetyltransferase involved in cellulose biosynthesis